MLKYDWLLTALIYGLIGYFRSKLSDFTFGLQNDRIEHGWYHYSWILWHEVLLPINCANNKMRETLEKKI